MLAWLSLRELWISFRLLAVLAVLLAAALPLALLPPTVVPDLAGAPLDRLGWFAVALGAALLLVAALAAATLSFERRRGTAGWLTLRAVPRSAILLGWFGAFALMIALGLVPAGLLAWLSLGIEPSIASRPGSFALALVGAWCAGAAAVAAGLVLGALLPRLLAVLATLLLAGGAVASGILGPLDTSPWPFAALAALAHLDDPGTPVADALRSGGAALALAAALLLLAAAALERAEL